MTGNMFARIDWRAIKIGQAMREYPFLTFGEIVTMTDLPTTTVSKRLVTLVEMGAAKRSAKGYELTTRGVDAFGIIIDAQERVTNVLNRRVP